jgi:hypothetical protein
MAFLSIKQSYDDYLIDPAMGQASGGNNSSGDVGPAMVIWQSFILARTFRR